MNGLTIEGIAPPLSPTVKPQSLTDGKDFAATFKSALAKTNHLQHRSDTAMQDVVKGEVDIHEGMMTVSDADLSLRLLLQVRSKVMEAYREISRM